MQVPTVRIVHPTAKGGYARINLSDFDPARHVLFDERRMSETELLEGLDRLLSPTPIQDDVPRETPAPRRRGRPRKTEA